jgi:hypothetical protein
MPAPCEFVLVIFGIVCPEPDQVVESLDDHSDDSIVRQGALGFLAAGAALSASPGMQLAQLGGEARLQLTPAPGST